MAETTPDALGARLLAGALRMAREDAKLGLREIARRLQKSHSVVSNWETGLRVPSAEDLGAYLQALGVDGDKRDQIIELSHGAGQTDWLAVGIPGMSQQLAGTMECERTARMITEYAPSVLPGLLQTSDMARAIIGGGGALSRAEVEGLLLVRMGRRDVLTRPDPVRLDALISEGALRDPIGGPKVMVAQLRALLAPPKSVTIRVVPQRIGWHPGLAGAFVLYDFPAAPSIVLLEHHRTGAFVSDASDVDAYQTAADEIRRVAMSPAASAELIAEIADEMEHMSNDG